MLHFYFNGGVVFFKIYGVKTFNRGAFHTYPLENLTLSSEIPTHIHSLRAFPLIGYCYFHLALSQPAAAGSGIPEVIGYLNGAAPARLMSWTTMVGKIIGVICAVGAGLAVGPEGKSNPKLCPFDISGVVQGFSGVQKPPEYRFCYIQVPKYSTFQAIAI